MSLLFDHLKYASQAESFIEAAKKYVGVLMARNASGASVLHLAAARPEHATEAICQNLLQSHKLNPNAIDYEGETPLFAAVGAVGGCKNQGTLSRSQLDIQERKVHTLLTHRADIDHRDATGKTVLFHAVYSSSCAAILKLLLSHGAPLGTLDRCGRNCSFYAKDRVIRSILEEAGLQLNESEPQGIPCTSRRPVVGDQVISASGSREEAMDAAGNKGAWELQPGEVATVVEVDREGDFRLRNPQGNKSEIILRKFFVYHEAAESSSSDEADTVVLGSVVSAGPVKERLYRWKFFRADTGERIDVSSPLGKKMLDETYERYQRFTAS